MGQRPYGSREESTGAEGAVTQDLTRSTIFAARDAEHFRAQAQNIKGADEIYPHYMFKFLQRHGPVLTDRARRTTDSGTIYIYMDCAKFLFGTGDRSSDLSFIRDITCLPPYSISQFCGYLLQHLCIQVIQHDIRAGGDKISRCSKTQSGGSASDESCFVV